MLPIQYLALYISQFVVVVTKYLLKRNLEGQLFVMSHGRREQSITLGKAWLQEHEAAGQLQKEMDDGACLGSSFLFSLGPQSMKCCCPRLGLVFPPLFTQDRNSLPVMPRVSQVILTPVKFTDIRHLLSQIQHQQNIHMMCWHIQSHCRYGQCLAVAMAAMTQPSETLLSSHSHSVVQKACSEMRP